MKAPVLIALALLSALPAAAEFVERNFVREVTPGRAFPVGTSLETIRADSLTAETVTYFDGMGREVLKVRRAAIFRVSQ